MTEENKIEIERKISIPLITNQELENILRYRDEIINKLSEHIYHDKEMIILQQIILNQQKEIEDLYKYNSDLKEKNIAYEEWLEGIEDFKETKRPIKELVVELNKFEDEFILKSKIEEKIKEIEKDKKSKYYEMFLHDRDIENTINILKELLESEE